MTRLSDRQLDELFALYKPFEGVRVNLAVDFMGAVSGHSGSSDDVSNATDRALLAHIRSISDVIVTTAATARAEHLRPSKFAPMVVLTQSGELHGLESLLSSTSELKPIVVVPSHQLAKARDQLLQAGQNAEVVGLLDLSPNQVIDFLNDQEGGFLGSLNDDCCGITCAKVASIKELIQRSGEFHLDKDSVDCLKDDIKGFSDDDYIQYYCF